MQKYSMGKDMGKSIKSQLSDGYVSLLEEHTKNPLVNLVGWAKTTLFKKYMQPVFFSNLWFSLLQPLPSSLTSFLEKKKLPTDPQIHWVLQTLVETNQPQSGDMAIWVVVPSKNFGEERKARKPLEPPRKNLIQVLRGFRKFWLGPRNVSVFVVVFFFGFGKYTWMWFEEKTCPKTVSAQFLWQCFQLWVLRIRKLTTKASLPLTCFEFMSLFTAPSFYSKEVSELLLVAKSTPQTSYG